MPERGVQREDPVTVLRCPANVGNGVREFENGKEGQHDRKTPSPAKSVIFRLPVFYLFSVMLDT